MKISYYPGCTLKTDAPHFEESSQAAFSALGIEFEELPRWNCCGTVFSFASDNVMYHLAPVRNLLRTREMGNERLLTLCSMCFNTLKRAAELFNTDAEKREKIRNIMYKENLEYDGLTRVVHGLELLRDEVGLDTLATRCEKRLKGLKIAPYYGCMLLRPDGLGIDDAEAPSIFEDIMAATGADVVDFAFKSECCGSYQTVNSPEIVAERTFAIIEGAHSVGADVIALSCPLCSFNLDRRQLATQKIHTTFQPMPIMYFSELLCLGLGIEYKDKWKQYHTIPVDPVLEKCSSGDIPSPPAVDSKDRGLRGREYGEG